MKIGRLCSALFLSALACGPAVAGDAPAAPPAGDIPFTLEGHAETGRLGVWLLESADADDTDPYVSLGAAIKSDTLIVHETGSVNQLLVENTSADRTVLILSGEIVKGGKQDRTLGSDMLVPPKSGKLPVESFCVEQSRWNQREGEAVTQFKGGAEKRAVGNAARNALRYSKDQGQVWAGVAASQQALSSNLKADVRDPKSATSLQLTLENPKVAEAVAKHRAALADLLAKHPKACGVAFLVNGKFSSAELFRNRAVFHRAYPALIEAAIVEAVAEEHRKAEVPAKDWHAFLTTAEKPEALREQQANAGTSHRVRAYKHHLRYDFLKDGKAIHTAWDARQPGDRIGAQEAPAQNGNPFLNRGNLQQQAPARQQAAPNRR